MKIRSLLVLLLISTLGYAQKTPDTELNLDSKITDVYLHEITGTPIVITNGGIYGIDGENGKIIWEFKESGFVSAMNNLGQDLGNSFTEVSHSPFGIFAQTVFNIKTGHKIIDPKVNAYEKIIAEKLILDKQAILFVAKTDNNAAKLFLVGVKNDSILWESAITSKKNLGSLFSHGENDPDFIQNKDRIAFNAGKTVFLVNKDNGELILSEKYDSGRLFFTEDNGALIAVEAKGGSLLGSALKAGFTMGLSLLGKKPIGKELVAFDVNSGKEFWKKPIKLDEGFIDYQFVDNKLFLIHEEGAVLYSPETGKSLWKKEFKKKKVKAIEKKTEGYMVYYKNRKHLVDNVGKKVWKKPEKVIGNVDFDVNDDEDFTSFDYDNGVLFVTTRNIEYFEKGKEKRVYRLQVDEKNDKLAYDEKNKNLIFLSEKKLYVLNPDKNLGKEQVIKIDFKEADKISSIEVRPNGYFINSNWEYVITDFKGNVKKQEFFTQPGEGGRRLKNFGAFVAGLGATKVTVSSSEKSLNSSSGFVAERNAPESQSFYVSKYHQEYEDLANYLYSPQRYSAFKATKNSAFFYTKKDDKKVLLQINKDSGELENSFEFGVNKPQYRIDRLASKIYFKKDNSLRIYSY